MKNGFIKIAGMALVALSLGSGAVSAQPSYAPTNSEPNPYQPGATFGQLPDGRKWGSTAGVDIAPDGTIWAYDRCGANTCVGSTAAPILHFDTSGKLLGSFGAGMFNFPHGLAVDKDGNVWVTRSGREPGERQGPGRLQVQSRGQGADDARDEGDGRRRARPCSTSRRM